MERLLICAGIAVVLILLGIVANKNGDKYSASMNLRCIHQYHRLRNKINAGGNYHKLEGMIDDFYGEFAGKAKDAYQYAEELYILLVKNQQHSNA